MKHISLLLVLCLLICCVACSAEETPPAGGNETAAVTTVSTAATMESPTITITKTIFSTTVIIETTATTYFKTNAVTASTTQKPTTPSYLIKDGRGEQGKTADGYHWMSFSSIYTLLGNADADGRAQPMAEYLLKSESLDPVRCVTVYNYAGGKSERLSPPEMINGYAVVAIYHQKSDMYTECNTYAKELVLHKMLVKVGMNYLPNVTDVYMPEAFVCGQLPSGMDEWPAEGITYHVPAASPLAAQLREKLTAAGVTHDLLTEDAVGVLDLSEADPIEADGKISFE